MPVIVESNLPGSFLGRKGRGWGPGRGGEAARNIGGDGLIERSVRSYVVRTIKSERLMWWLTLLGTEPRKKRLAPVIPLLPTTNRS